MYQKLWMAILQQLRLELRTILVLKFGSEKNILLIVTFGPSDAFYMNYAV